MFNDKNIEKLESFYKDLESVRNELTIEYNNAQDISNEKKYKTMRKNPEGVEVEVELEGKTLWYEIRNLGFKCDGATILRVEFPKVFDLQEKHEAMVNKLNEFSKLELGVDPLAMTLLDVVKIAKGVSENNK